MGAQIDVNQKSEIFGISVGLATRFFRDDDLGEQGVWQEAGGGGDSGKFRVFTVRFGEWSGSPAPGQTISSAKCDQPASARPQSSHTIPYGNQLKFEWRITYEAGH